MAKIFTALTDGKIGIAAGHDAYSIEISKGDKFEITSENDYWYFAKKQGKRKETRNYVPAFSSREYATEINWDELLLTFPKNYNGDVYAKFGEVK